MTNGKFKQRKAVSFWLGMVLLIVASAGMFLLDTISAAISAVLIFGVVITLTNYFTYIGVNEKGRDERARKLGTMAATLSWYVSLMFIGFVAVFSFWNGRQFSTAKSFGVMIFLMAASMAVAMIYYEIRGDVE